MKLILLHRLSLSTVIHLLLVIFLLLLNAPVYAQDSSGKVQEIQGKYDLGDGAITYLLPDLLEGQVLSIFVEGTDGNFDPFIVLLDSEADVEQIGETFDNLVDTAIENNRDPLLVIPEVADEAFLIWNDDTGDSFAASFTYGIPEDGDYQLIVLTSPLFDTFGAYRLLVGLDADDVVSGTAEHTGDEIAIFTGAGRNAESAVQIIEGELSAEIPDTFYNFNDFFPDDTLYVHIESTAGNLRPLISLISQGTKPVRNGNYDEDGQRGWFEFDLPEGGSGYQIDIVADTIGNEVSTGTYRLTVGRNVPEVLDGQAEEKGLPFLRLPIPVEVGVKLQQITGIDQTAENYGAVYTIRFTWNDPNLAFSTDECQCKWKIFNGEHFSTFATEEGIIWPLFTIFNQQGNRWAQNKTVVVSPDGNVIYIERFTTTLQAPDFNFEKFPFDKQEFFLGVDSLFPTEFFTYESADDYTEVGSDLGEEEWYIVNAEVSIGEEQVTTESVTPSYEFRFFAQRHLIFYIFRIFVPLGLIILVAWITFFMDDFSKRVDATTANLLLFIAFNFTISGDLPRLGYLTYLDTLLVCTFLVSVLIVAYNVALKRLENAGNRERADKIDRYMIWLYPLIYVIAFGLVTLYYFGNIV